MKQTLVMAFVTYVSAETSGVTATPLSKVLDLLDGMNAACKPLKALHPPPPITPATSVPQSPQPRKPSVPQAPNVALHTSDGDKGIFHIFDVS